MSNTRHPEKIVGAGHTEQGALPFETEGVQRVVWKLAQCDILIEVKDGVVYVNGDPVEPIDVTLKKGLR